MSEGNEWTVEAKGCQGKGIDINIEDITYKLNNEMGTACIAHAILLLLDTHTHQASLNREANQEIYEDSRDRYSRLDEKRKDLEAAIEELVEKESEWKCARTTAPFAKVLVKFENGDELPAKFVGGNFLSPLGIPYANVKSWRYVDAD